MTLVVAHRTPYGVRLCSDMRVTDRGAARPPSYLNAVLKAVILHPQLCVAFAGSVPLALQAIRRLDVPRDSDADVARVAEVLLNSHRQEAGMIDFLIAGLQPTTLSRVWKGGVERDLHAAWIGDHDAFSVFQAAYVGGGAIPRRFAEGFPDGLVPTTQVEAITTAGADMEARWAATLPRDEFEDFRVASRSMAAMHAVVESSLKEVGEAAIFVAPRPPNDPNGYFAYLEASFAYNPRGLSEPGSASAEQGGESFAILTPSEPGFGAIGIYIVEARLGLLYYPAESADPLAPQTFAGHSVGEFRDAVHQQHGFEIGGIGIGAWDE
jgi:hypothetical protein